ncbi:dUTP diphosphatase [Bacillus mycoides]|uniref:dUTP diphosphatase n=1 Tax=Bacillus mycoides TaxID=1405 RepID=UPI002E2055F4|nr:dUTP diphosphatase [Bacillus mycoides]
MLALHKITDAELKTDFDLNELFNMQRKLDKRINYKGEDRVELKFFSLHVEVNEAWNETKSFKFWSTKFKEPDRDKVLKELVDALHFMLSIVLDLNQSSRKKDKVKQFRYVNMHSRNIYSINRLFEMWSTSVFKAKKKWVAYRIFPEKDLRDMFGALLRISYLYGFTYGDVVTAYKDKNAENFTRQETGY